MTKNNFSYKNSMEPQPKTVNKSIQALILEFEWNYANKEIPQVDIRNFLRRLKLAMKIGQMVVAPYFTEKMNEIEAEMKRAKLAKEKDLQRSKEEEKYVRNEKPFCVHCKQSIDVDRDCVGWNSESGWYHVGTCPKGQEREINGL